MKIISTSQISLEINDNTEESCKMRLDYNENLSNFLHLKKSFRKVSTEQKVQKIQKVSLYFTFSHDGCRASFSRFA